MPDNRRSWSWPQFAMALGLLPISLLVWIIGMQTADWGGHGRSPDFGFACVVAAPFIGIAGMLWLLVLLMRGFSSMQQGEGKS
jgi:hypothetical protein